jgi:polyphosphate kinase 2 (PPK2 family)
MATMKKMKRKKFEKRATRPQAKLCVLQDWVKEKGSRVIVVF